MSAYIISEFNYYKDFCLFVTFQKKLWAGYKKQLFRFNRRKNVWSEGRKLSHKHLWQRLSKVC